MGYYSEVGLCLTQEGEQILAKAIDEEKGDGVKKMVEDFLCEAIRYCDDASGAVAYYWDNVKWYADFLAVRFIENLTVELNWENFLFIRVGEDSDDTEYRGGFWDNPFPMGLARSITFD